MWSVVVQLGDGVLACKVVPVDLESILYNTYASKINGLTRLKFEEVQLGQRAAIYARVSTADQSCERQVAELTAFADRGDFKVIGVFKDTASGTKANRLARNRIIELAQARKIDAVLVTELSRWGRSIQDLLDTLNRFSGWKVSIVAMNGMTFELDTPHGCMMATMLARIAQFERDLLE